MAEDPTKLIIRGIEAIERLNASLVSQSERLTRIEAAIDSMERSSGVLAAIEQKRVSTEEKRLSTVTKVLSTPTVSSGLNIMLTAALLSTQCIKPKDIPEINHAAQSAVAP